MMKEVSVPPGVWRAGLVLFIVVAIFRARASVPDGLDAQLTILQFGIALVLTLLFLPEIRRHRVRRIDWTVTISMAAFLALLAFTWPLSAVPIESLSQTAIFAVMAAFVLGTYLFRWDSRDIVAGDLFAVYLAVAGAQTIGLVGYLSGLEWASGYYDRFVGLFSNANYAGMISAFTLPLVVFLVAGANKSTQAIALIAALPLAGGLFASLSRGALIATAVGLSLGLILVVRRLWFTICTLILGATLTAGVVAYSFALRSQSTSGLTQDSTDLTSGRFDLAATLLAQWLQAPILGHGYRASASITDGLEAHNLFLSILVETGIVGAICVAAVVVSLAVASNGWRASTAVAASVAILVSELTESSLFGWGSPTTVVAWIVLFAPAALGRYHEKPLRDLAHLPRA